MAECKLGRGDRAYSIYKQSMFTERSLDQGLYKVEPYVHAEYVCGPDSTRFGQGEFTWATASAAWMWRVALDYILGVRPDYPGLLIDPCIPGDWREFKVIRPFRNAIYDITVSNPDGISKGVRRIMADDTEVETGQSLPDFADRKTHKIMVEMGE
jgi:cellobiose phosphorylase